jgi:GntR family transcriptional regulator, vanillate catabolism transcriptional regulator
VRLREMILKGDFQGGERISELPLVAMLGVSRTPIRLALERLAHEGLLEPYPTGGFIVREFTLDDVWDSIDVRGTLEGTAARLAAERISSANDLEELRTIQRQIDTISAPPTPDEFPLYLEFNDAFHAEIVRLSRSTMLRLTLDRLFCLPFAAPSALVTSPLNLPDAPDRFRLGNEHHHVLTDAIARGHGAFADSMAREHARLTRRHLEEALNDKNYLSSLPGGTLIRSM